VVFEVNWGAAHGADPRRLLAMACRRGDVESRDVGAIDVGPRASRVQIAAHVAARFAAAARRPDPRDPRVAFRRARARPPASATLARNPWTSRRSSKSKA
jgi:ATP-dependent RNA helicase DeaD